MALLFKRKDVVIITTNFFCLTIAASGFQAVKLREVSGEEVPLDAGGKSEFLFHMLFDQGIAEVPGIFESDGGLGGKTCAKLEVGFAEDQAAHTWATDDDADVLILATDGKHQRSDGQMKGFGYGISGKGSGVKLGDLITPQLRCWDIQPFLTAHRRLPVLPSDKSVFGKSPAARNGETNEAGDFVRIKCSGQAAAEVEQSAQFLESLIKEVVGGANGIVGLRIGDYTCAKAKQRSYEINVFNRNLR